MKKLLIAFITVGALVLPALAAAPYYVAGDFNGWNSSGNLMTETFLGSGIWQAPLSMSTGYHIFKVTDGTWSWNVPGSGNSWLYTDGSGNVTITYDANTYADGWIPIGGAGVRAAIWAMPVQRRTRVVAPATAASGEKASLLHDSPVQTESNPRSSAAVARAMSSRAGRGAAVQYPNWSPSLRSMAGA